MLWDLMGCGVWVGMRRATKSRCQSRATYLNYKEFSSGRIIFAGIQNYMVANCMFNVHEIIEICPVRQILVRPFIVAKDWFVCDGFNKLMINVERG